MSFVRILILILSCVTPSAIIRTPAAFTDQPCSSRECGVACPLLGNQSPRPGNLISTRMHCNAHYEVRHCNRHETRPFSGRDHMPDSVSRYFIPICGSNLLAVNGFWGALLPQVAQQNQRYKPDVPKPSMILYSLGIHQLLETLPSIHTWNRSHTFGQCNPLRTRLLARHGVALAPIHSAPENLDGVPTAKIEVQLRRHCLVSTCSWHHTPGYYRRTDNMSRQRVQRMQCPCISPRLTAFHQCPTYPHGNLKARFPSNARAIARLPPVIAARARIASFRSHSPTEERMDTRAWWNLQLHAHRLCLETGWAAFRDLPVSWLSGHRADIGRITGDETCLTD
ncbi:hypothetical protein NEOLEDRAFT_1225203 [Neolentinus lepideus HHB14362 ss-1]|uniref:Uncharacterized protein n=1 Tax=Neolentinus lepideus HHB14362 ss-1 TaxID=1314782 RepID=A0A165PJV8_9AGAM|nr:hypothetical protein NEOLEDRAFT_1225203 [Neolentinus lepideus HHB14362 ss-1]